VAFDSAEAYARFMGRFSEPLAPIFADAAGLAGKGPVLDVGCGPGVLTAVLVERYGADAVSAVDPSAPFVDRARTRLPGVDVRQGAAEDLPFADESFAAALAQLVVHFMADAVRGLREMARVTRSGGLVAACVWDHHGGRGPLSLFWSAAESLRPGTRGESSLAGSREGHLRELFLEAGLTDVEDGRIDVTVPFASFEEWWEPFTMGVGPAGDHVASLDPAEVEALAEECRRRLPEPPFELTVSAWLARGRSAE
jgi:SAM-dependent methyltransferase